MPIRIYALAKELDIDSKELVDVCNKAGVTGKGSALASLTDDEVAKIKAHLNKSAAPAAPARSSAGSTPPPMVRPTPARTTGKIPVISAKKAAPAKPETAPAAPPSPPPTTAAPVEPTTSAPAASKGLSSKPPIDIGRSKSKKQEAPKPAVAPPPKVETTERNPVRKPEQHPNKVGFTRDDYIAPGGAGGKPPVLGGAKPKSSGGNEPKGGSRQSKRAPSSSWQTSPSRPRRRLLRRRPTRRKSRS